MTDSDVDDEIFDSVSVRKEPLETKDGPVVLLKTANQIKELQTILKDKWVHKSLSNISA